LKSDSYTLYTFEQPQTQSITPGKSRCYFIVSEDQGRCDKLLSDMHGSIVCYTQDQINQQSEFGFDSSVYESILGEWNNSIYSVLLIKEKTVHDHQWMGLRKKLGVVEDTFFLLAGRALQLCQWQMDHRFCGRCGRPTQRDQQDSALVCASCQLRFYPRISPCMIVAVTRDDEILLAYHKRATRPVYSTLAGFVEAGERVEDCVIREVQEEVGIRVKNLRYLFSQPWPFPSQLMLGFIAEYQSGEIIPDEKEILDARWFRYDALPEIPSPASAAGQLIAFFVQQQKNKGTPR
jgi:NAD+ diphosphatase